MNDVVGEPEVVRRVTNSNISLHGQLHHIGILIHINIRHRRDLPQTYLIELHCMLKLVMRKVIISSRLDIFHWLLRQIVNVRRIFLGVLLLVDGIHALDFIHVPQQVARDADLLIQPRVYVIGFQDRVRVVIILVVARVGRVMMRGLVLRLQV